MLREKNKCALFTIHLSRIVWEKETHFRQQETLNNSLQTSHLTIIFIFNFLSILFIKYFSALLTSSDLGRWGELGFITRSVIASYFLIQFHFGWEYWEGADLKRDYHRWLLVPVKIYFHSPLMFISQHFKGDFAFALVTCIRELRARINMMNMFVFWIVSIGNKKLPSYQNTCREMLHFYTERGNNNVLVLWPSNLNSKVKQFNIKINNKCCLTNKDWSKVV